MIAKQLAKRTKFEKQTTRAGNGLYFLVFIILIAVAGINYLPAQAADANQKRLISQSANTQIKISDATLDKNSIDKVMASNLAAELANEASLPVAANVASLSVSNSIEADSAQKIETVVSKPEIVSLGSAKQGVKLYVAQEGDTLDKLALSSGVSAQTIKWSNGLVTDKIEPGKEIKILPVDGVYYKVLAGDTYDKIIQRYGSNEGRIVAINNLEVSGLIPESMIIIPEGILPETERPGYVAPRTVIRSTGGSNTSVYMSRNYNAFAGNRYAPGWCTWYAYNRYAELNGGRTIGSFWGNANTWDNAASASGAYTVSYGSPIAGAIFQTDAGWAGHVGVVESINYNADGSIASINVSDMNGIAHYRWGIGYQTWDAAKYRNYRYIK